MASAVSKALTLIQGAASLQQRHQIHALLLKTSLDCNIFVLAKFLRHCLANTSPPALCYCRSIFDQIRSPDAFLWNTLIRAYLNSPIPHESLRLFHQMKLRGVPSDSFTLSLALQACGRFSEHKTAETIHTQVFKLGFVSDLFVQTVLLELYAKVKDIRVARRVFDEMPERDVISHNIMLTEYLGCGNIAEAQHLFDEMPMTDIVTWNTMIHGYAMSGDLSAAREMFNRTPERDLISWRSLISAYAQSGQSNEALRLFQEMQLAGVVPDKVTMVSVLSACGDTGALGMGMVIHEFIRRKGVVMDLRLGTSLVDMYAKCGDIESSLVVFSKMNERDALAWSTMITGLANHGFGRTALDLFLQMTEEGIKPNDLTFVGVLTACSHACLLSESWGYFKSMWSVHSLNPKIEHYGCMVDLLGRAGHIEEARQLISDMPYEPDAVVWRVLLGACKIHKSVRVAEEAMSNLINLEPRVDGHYVLQSNVYAQANRWYEVAKMRKMMRSMDIRKVPGSSSIEVDNVVHEFVADDRSHPECYEIHKMLSKIVCILKHIRNKPMASSALQGGVDISEDFVLVQHTVL